MRCPACMHPESRVIDSRTLRDGEAIRRRRECDRCGERFTTYERIEETTPQVVKKDGTREPFDRDKVRRGIVLACNKRDVPDDAIDAVVERVVQAVLGGGEREVPAQRIGRAVAEELMALDQVAYVRFESVYRRFEDTGEFRDALERLRTPATKGEDE